MEKSTKKGLIAVGATLGTLAIVYYILRQKAPKPTNNTPTTPFPLPNQKFDPYSLVDKTTKIQAIKDYLKSNASELQKSAYAQGLDPVWTFADSYAKTTNDGINSWYAAIQKNEPTFIFYNSVTLANQKIDTKTGQKV